jgi:hypothetical protein
MEVTLLLAHLLLLHQLEAGKAALTLAQELLEVLVAVAAAGLVQAGLVIPQQLHQAKVILVEMAVVRHQEVLVGVVVLER